MPRIPEPCLCGDPECGRCFVQNYEEEEYVKIDDEVPPSFEDEKEIDESLGLHGWGISSAARGSRDCTRGRPTLYE